jgi:hypothetical protein
MEPSRGGSAVGGGSPTLPAHRVGQNQVQALGESIARVQNCRQAFRCRHAGVSALLAIVDGWRIVPGKVLCKESIACYHT